MRASAMFSRDSKSNKKKEGSFQDKKKRILRKTKPKKETKDYSP
jgi:hypothetical protein